MTPPSEHIHTATAMLFTHSGAPVEKVELPIPEPGDDEILVRITYTTICTSDLHTVSGRRQAPCPCVLGHEIVGILIRKGPNITTDYNGKMLSAGDRITWSVYAHDPNSIMAQKGIPQKSAGLYKYGHQSFTPDDGLNGGFASHCLLRQGTAVYRLPDTVSDQVAAPLNCTHATIAGAMRLAGNVQGKRVLVTGAGMLGLSACAMAAQSGALAVYAMERQAARLLHARQFGATTLWSEAPQADWLSETIRPDVVIDTTGIPQVMEQGLELLAIGGTAVWVGAVFTQESCRISAEMIVRRMLTIKGLHNYTPEDLATALEFITLYHHHYPFARLIGLSYPLTDLDAALKRAAAGTDYRVGICQEAPEPL